MLDPQDGGTGSRKLWFAAGTSVGIVALGVLAGTVAPGLGQHLSTVTDSLLMCLGIYCGANVGHKLVYGKTMGPLLTQQAQQEDDTTVEPQRPPAPEPVPPQGQ